MATETPKKETAINSDDKADLKKEDYSAKTPKTSAYTISRRVIGDEPTETDTLGFEPYVNAVKDFLTANATKPPLTLSIEGKWGSGKSSFMQQLRSKLEGEAFQRSRKNKDRLNLTVEFNPWRHDKEDALWAAFALHFISEISNKLPFTARWSARYRLLRTRYDWKGGWLDCFKAFCFGIAIVSIIFAVPMLLYFNGIEWLTWFVDQLPMNNKLSDIIVKWVTGLGSAGAVFGVLITIWIKVKEYLSNPLSFDLRKHLESPDYSARIAFVENFHKDFKKIVDAYIGQKHAFVLIDDLDRCDVPKAADLMQAINLMISSDPRLFFIIGMDREKVAAGLAVKFEKAIPYLVKEITSDESKEEVLKRKRGIEFGYTFIEKFIQIPFIVPQPKADKLETLLALDSPTTITLNEQLKREIGFSVFGKLRFRLKAWLHSNTEKDDDSKSDDPGRLQHEPVTELRDADLTDEQRAIRQKYRFMLSETDSETLGSIVSWVTTFLDANPRRIKQFINLFRLKALIANETGLFDPHDEDKILTIEQLAKFVVITLRWPLFLRDLETDLDLFAKLDSSYEWEPSSIQELWTARWRDHPALMNLLNYGCDRKEDGFNYHMSLVNVERLLQVSPRVRSTDIWTPEQIEPEIDITEPDGIEINENETIVTSEAANEIKNEPIKKPSYKKVNILIASSEELMEDSTELNSYILKQNDHFMNEGVYLETNRWESIVDTMSNKRLPDNYHKQLLSCDIYVGLFFTKVGKYAEEEFDVVYQHSIKHGKPVIYIYFKDVDIIASKVEKENMESLWEFQDKLKDLGLYYNNYKSVENLKSQFRDQIYRQLIPE